MTFEPIDLNWGSDITFSLRRWSRDTAPFISIVHLAFSGTYRIGSAGSPDAFYIKGIMSTVDGAWRPSATILDFSQLSYEWGDEMDLLLPGREDRDIALIVSDKCSKAMATLCFGINTERKMTEFENCFESFSEAVRFIGTHQVESWNEHVRTSTYIEKSKLITLADLGIAG